MNLAVIAATVALSGCVSSERQVVVQPARPRPAVVAVQAPPPRPVVVAVQPPPQVVVQQAYAPAPNDIYIAGVPDRDVVFMSGDTFIWVVGPDGRRHQHFYGHGDRRAEVFHRREHLRVVMAHHNGHLPRHAIAARRDDHRGPVHAPRPAYAHQGGPARHASAQGNPQHGHAPERVADHHGHDHDANHHDRPRHVEEAQQPAPHHQGHAGA